MPERLWNEAEHVAAQIKGLRSADDTDSDIAAVQVGKLFRRKIEARKRVEKKLYPGGEVQRELAEMRQMMRRMAQAQFHSIGF